MSTIEVTPATALSESELPLARFYRWELERPGHPFLTQPLPGGVRQWSWAEAARETRRMAAYLEAQHWTPGTHVAIVSKNCAWWIMADVAIWMAGHVSVPVYPSLSAAAVRGILEHSEAKALFVGATDDPAPAGGLPTVRFPTAAEGPGRRWDAIVESTSPSAGPRTRSSGELATIFYTSGTTGAPKGVMHSFGALSFLTRALTARLDLSGDQRFLSYLPLAHILERSAGEIPALLQGWHVFFAQSPDTFVEDLKRARPTLFFAVPRVLQKLHQGVLEKIPASKLNRLLRIPIVGSIVRRRILGGLGLDEVRFAASGAAPLAPELLMWYRGLGLDLVEGYGLTEALVTHVPRAEDVRPGYSGYALDGVSAKLGEGGELLLKSPMNMLGYYRDPRATEEAFTADGFFRTGDVVEMAPDGQIKIVGRIKEQFKTSKGKYVAPAPIEIRLAAHPDLESCCVMGVGMSKPFAVCVLTPEAKRRASDSGERRKIDDSLARLLESVNDGLEHHERIGFLAITGEPWTIANGLITPTMKLKRKALEEHYRALVDGWTARGGAVVWE
jgi:long-chain acyl-CoA synthetase